MTRSRSSFPSLRPARVSPEGTQRLCFFILISSVKSQTCRKHPPSPREVDSGHCPFQEGGAGGQGVGVGRKVLIRADLHSGSATRAPGAWLPWQEKKGFGVRGTRSSQLGCPRNINLRNVGVEGWLSRQISYKVFLFFFFFFHRCPKALGQWLHPSSSSPVTIKQALKEEYDRGYFGLLSLLVRERCSPRKMGLPPSLLWDLISSGMKI